MSTHNMFTLRNKINICSFWLKKVYWSYGYILHPKSNLSMKTYVVGSHQKCLTPYMYVVIISLKNKKKNTSLDNALL